MNLVKRLKRECMMQPVMWAGYSRKMASVWYRKRCQDREYFEKKYDKAFIDRLHKAGYLCRTAKKYGITDPEHSTYISDFDYRFLWPYNSSFSKWIEDIITTKRVLKDHPEVCRDVYFSIFRREGRNRILPIGGSREEKTVKHIISCLKEHGELELRPVFWASPRHRYHLRYSGGTLYVNRIASDETRFAELIQKLSANYVVADCVELAYSFSEDFQMDHALKLWIANDAEEKPAILSAVMNLYWDKIYYFNGSEVRERKHEAVLFNAETGGFTYNGKAYQVSRWAAVQEKVQAVSYSMKQLNYFSMSIALKEDGSFSILHFADYPKLPEIPYHDALNVYLKKKADDKRTKTKLTFKDRKESVKNSWFKRFVGKYCRKGVRPYMQRLWFDAVRDDLFHTKGISLGKKLWAWKRGFFSYRIWQYGLTEENCRSFLSDYDYYWLNRINNNYQKWVNDKTTYRLMMEPFKEYLPKYYFSVYKRNGKMELARMWDCPGRIPDDTSGFLQLLRKEKMLAFKPSAGTHGDGFYCLSYQNGRYEINGKESSEEGIIRLLGAQKSFYVVTEYITIHDELKKIYAKSVNTVRVMVVNRHGYDPEIMQTYMRIGSSRTGFTDNVGYGGICVMVNKDTGKLYKPQTIQDHVFCDCPNHPDTGTPIAGFLPNWELMRRTVLDIARYLGELEYLGFDVALTNEGLSILEINIHQDLHKVADFTDEMNEFFQRKIRNKMSQFNLTQ